MSNRNSVANSLISEESSESHTHDPEEHGHQNHHLESTEKYIIEEPNLELNIFEQNIEENSFEKSSPDQTKDVSNILLSPIDSTPTTGNNYNKYSPARKQMLVFISSLACFLSPMSTLALLPAVPIIAARFNTTGNIINISNAVYCVVMAISPCVFQPVSDFYGRRPVFFICLFCFTISTVLVAVSVNLSMFFIFRACMALFGTAFFSAGAQVIGDIYKPTERGNAMGWILSGSQVGPAIGPVLGGAIITASDKYWRVIFYMLAGLGLVNLVLAVFFLPETCYETKMQTILKEANSDKKFLLIFRYGFNPFSVITSLTYPSLTLAGICAIALSFNMYVMLTPIRYVVDPRFNLTTPVFGSLFYLAPGCGYLFGSFFGGKLSDYYLRKWIKKRNGVRIAEDRLRAAILPLGLIYPVSTLIYGWSLQQKKGGMAVPIIFMFIGGVAQTCTFPALNTYCVDSMPQLKGSAIGGNYFIRFVSAAIASAVCLVSIENIGVGWTSTISSFVLWIGFASIILLIKYGKGLRERYSKT